MAQVISVWSKVLQPGQEFLFQEDVSVQITNIALEVDEAAEASSSSKITRSVVKMQHLEADPEMLAYAAGLLDDSDEDDIYNSEDDSDDDEDDEDVDEDDAMDADMSKLSKVSKASSTGSKKAAKVNGAAEEEDEESSEGDFDFDNERQEAEVQVCSLIAGQVEQIQTNVVLVGGEDYVFKLSGPHKVHLLGNFIIQPGQGSGPGGYDQPPYDSDDEITSDEEDMSDSEMGRYDPETGLMLGDSDDEEEDDSRFMEIADEPKPKKAAKAVAAEAKKPAAAAAAAPASAAAPVEAAAADTSKLSKNQLKKLAKKEKTAAAPAEAAKPAAAAAAPAPAAVKKEEAKPAAAAKKAPSKKQTTASGLTIEDNKVGSGPAAKAGQRVQMRYIGRLQNGKIFDQNTKGAPFSFKLGKQEVIKGWDEGIAGMQVGGERKLVIPPQLAYGKQAISGIPPNSTLTFEVKLLAIK